MGRRPKQMLLIATLALIAILVAACDGATPVPPLEDPQNEAPIVTPPLEDPVDPEAQTPQGPELPAEPKPVDQGTSNEPSDYVFSVDVLEESFEYGGSLESASVTWRYSDEQPFWSNVPLSSPRLVIAEVNVTGAEDLVMLYAKLHYDIEHLMFEYAYAGNYTDLDHFEELRQQGTLFAPINVLPFTLTDSDDAFVTFGGPVERPQEASGFSGDGVLMRIYFVEYTPVPGATPAQWGPKPPTLEDCQTAPTYDSATSTLRWAYLLPGDYNQDGTVNGFDFGTAAYHWNEVADGIDSIAGVITNKPDGTVWIDAEINLAMHGLNSLDCYNVYMGIPESYPDGGALVGSVDFSDALGDPLRERLYFEYSVPAGVSGTQIWVKPAHDGETGIASLPVTF